MMNKTVLMLSASCMSFIVGADLCYAGFNPYDTPPALNSALLYSRNSTHTSHLTAGHLSSLEDFSLSSSNLLRGSRSTSPLRGEVAERSDAGEGDKNIQLAAACFVTDTTDCSGNEFAGNNADDDNGGVPPGGSDDDYDLDDEKRCEEEGYTMTSCPEDSDPVNFCPYDNTYFEKCKANCPSDYVTCEPPYHGVGEACGDKYTSCECTPCGSGYDYTTIPEGYVQDGEACLDCDGKTKYKIKPNPCDGFMDCGSMGPEAGANTCQSGTEIKYDNCKPCPNECSMDSCPSPYTCKKEECSNKYCKTGCQSGYVWNANSQTCTCDPSIYKYTCTGTDQKGSGQACDGKYKSCTCSNGKSWNSSECVCDSSYKYTCTGTNESPSGTSCNGKYRSCSCNRPYEWKYGNCGCSGSYSCTRQHETGGVGTPCEGKYNSCTCEEPYYWNGTGCSCEFSYRYTCEEEHKIPASLPCNGKYKACTCEKDYIMIANKCICDGEDWMLEYVTGMPVNSCGNYMEEGNIEAILDCQEPICVKDDRDKYAVEYYCKIENVYIDKHPVTVLKKMEAYNIPSNGWLSHLYAYPDKTPEYVRTYYAPLNVSSQEECLADGAFTKAQKKVQESKGKYYPVQPSR